MCEKSGERKKKKNKKKNGWTSFTNVLARLLSISPMGDQEKKEKKKNSVLRVILIQQL